MPAAICAQNHITHYRNTRGSRLADMRCAQCGGTLEAAAYDYMTGQYLKRSELVAKRKAKAARTNGGEGEGRAVASDRPSFPHSIESACHTVGQYLREQCKDLKPGHSRIFKLRELALDTGVDRRLLGKVRKKFTKALAQAITPGRSPLFLIEQWYSHGPAIGVRRRYEEMCPQCGQPALIDRAFDGRPIIEGHNNQTGSRCFGSGMVPRSAP